MIALVPLTGIALEEYQIKASKKTASKYEGSEQQRLKVSTKATRKDTYYEVEVRRMSPNAPKKVEVEWAILIELVNGQLKLAEQGSKSVSIPYGMTKKIETGTAMLKGREIDGPFRSSDIEDDIAGYGIRIKDSEGNVLAEKYSKSSVENYIKEAIKKKEKQRTKQVKVKQDISNQLNKLQNRPRHRPRRRLPPKLR